MKKKILRTFAVIVAGIPPILFTAGPALAALDSRSATSCGVREESPNPSYFRSTTYSKTVASGQTSPTISVEYLGPNTYPSNATAWATNVIVNRTGADTVLRDAATDFSGFMGSYDFKTFTAWNAGYASQTMSWYELNDDGTKGNLLCSATVTFAGPPTITVNSVGVGTASAADAYVTSGGSTTLTAVPGSGQAVTWTCTVGSLSSTWGDVVTLSSISADTVCTATFSTAYILTVTTAGNSGSAAASITSLPEGGQTSMNANPTNYMDSTSWSCSGGILSSTSGTWVTLSSMPSANVSCVATFTSTSSGINYGHSGKTDGAGTRDRKSFSSDPSGPKPKK